VESVLEVIAEPNCRAILSLLVSSQQSVGEIERQLRIPQPAVSKHLRVLREASFVESTVDAQRRLHLDRMDRSTSTKGETKMKMTDRERYPPSPASGAEVRKDGKK
jgi:DNA-binding transcriptional ArsR family regulator